MAEGVAYGIPPVPGAVAGNVPVFSSNGQRLLDSGVPPGGGGNPGGSSGQFQYNNSGTFGGFSGAVLSGGKIVIGAGTWEGDVLTGTYGGTGVNNGAHTVTLGGSLTISGAYTTTLIVTANTSVTLPINGTLATTTELAAYAPLAGATFTGSIYVTNGGNLYFGSSGYGLVFSDNSTQTTAALPLTGGVLSSGAQLTLADDTGLIQLTGAPIYYNTSGAYQTGDTSGNVAYTNLGTLNFGAATLTLDGVSITSWSVGTVTSVGLTVPSSLLSVSPSSITTSGTFEISLISAAAGKFLATPATGPSATPTLRAIVDSDVPTLNQNTTGTAANITGTTNATITTLLALTGFIASANGVSATYVDGEATIALGAITPSSVAATGNTSTAGQSYIPPQTLTDGGNSGTITWSVNSGGVAQVTLGGTGETLAITNAVAGATYIIKLKQGVGGSFTVTTWTVNGNAVKWPGGTAPTLSTAAGAEDIITIVTYAISSSVYGYGVFTGALA